MGKAGSSKVVASLQKDASPPSVINRTSLDQPIEAAEETLKHIENSLWDVRSKLSAATEDSEKSNLKKKEKQLQETLEKKKGELRGYRIENASVAFLSLLLVILFSFVYDLFARMAST